MLGLGELRGAAVAKRWRCREELLGKAAGEEEKACVRMEPRRRSMAGGVAAALAMAMARIPMGRARICCDTYDHISSFFTSTWFPNPLGLFEASCGWPSGFSCTHGHRPPLARTPIHRPGRRVRGTAQHNDQVGWAVAH
jgi:hypothetical protein